MDNSTLFISFVLSAYENVGLLKYLYFTIISLLYIAIVFANTMLIVVISMERKLHQPMYLFLCSLFVNELYGSAAVLPFLMVQVLSDTHVVPAHYCYLQIYIIYTYASIEFCNLAAMAYDRYVSICYPLQYHVIMTSNRVIMIIMLLWIYSFIKFSITLSLSVSLTMCGNTINKVYCNNYSLVQLACSDTTVNNYYGLFGIVLSVAVPVIPISFSYIKILGICLRSSKETRQKALSTCTPHLASLINFSFGCCFEILQSRFDMTHVPAVLRIIISLYFLVCQPLFNPVLYGFNLSTIKQQCKTLFLRKYAIQG
ncbi:olfactory receptor 10A3-like [Hypomesus transpacificus]|uniref:olfactory receptor 10A3-like n=1 Tax=Hypomesus transpacificus TaxID=137520 RepID=UPI001F07FAF7|nr:olfactory receptor 10A3-like [Hypomesus transpacificus]